MPVRKPVTLDWVTTLCVDMIRNLVLNLLKLRVTTTAGILQLLPNSTEQIISWESNRFSASQEIPRILLNPKVRYHVYNSPPLVLILRQINSIHASPSHILKIRFKIILPPMPRSFKFSLPFAFPHQTPVRTTPLHHTRSTPRPPHSSWFGYQNNSWWAVRIKKLLVMQFSPLLRYLVPLCYQHLLQRLTQSAQFCTKQIGSNREINHTSSFYIWILISTSGMTEYAHRTLYYWAEQSGKLKVQFFFDVTPCPLVNAVGSSIDKGVTFHRCNARRNKVRRSTSPPWDLIQ